MNLGIILMIVGGILLILSAVLFIVIQSKSKVISVEDFDKKFLLETSINPSKTELNSERKRIAQNLNIRTNYRNIPSQPITPQPVRSYQDETFLDNVETNMINDDATERLNVEETVIDIPDYYQNR